MLLVTSAERFDLAFADGLPYTGERNSDSMTLSHFCHMLRAKLLRYEWQSSKDELFIY